MADLNLSSSEFELTYDRIAWVDWTPTVTPATGSGTAVTINNAQYYEIGNTVYFVANITVDTVGTGGGALDFTLPLTPDETAAEIVLGTGREGAATGSQLNVHLITGGKARVYPWDNAAVWVVGRQFVVRGMYRV